MATQEKSASTWLDTALLWLAVIVLCGSIFGYYWFEATVNDLIRVVGMLGGGIVAVLIALQTEMGRTAWGYIQGSRTELRRVVWPNRQETLQTTLMVVIVVLVLATFIWAMDIVLGWAVQLLAGRR